MDWDDRIFGACSFFVTGTVIFEPFGFIATIFFSVVLGLLGFLVGGKTTASQARRGL